MGQNGTIPEKTTRRKSLLVLACILGLDPVYNPKLSSFKCGLKDGAIFNLA